MTLLTLLGDPGRPSGAESPESARAAGVAGDFESLFAAVSGGYGPVDPAPSDEASGGMPLPALPSGRQDVAGSLDGDPSDTPESEGLPGAAIASPYAGAPVGWMTPGLHPDPHAPTAADPAAPALPKPATAPAAMPADATGDPTRPAPARGPNDPLPPMTPLAAGRPAGDAGTSADPDAVPSSTAPERRTAGTAAGLLAAQVLTAPQAATGSSADPTRPAAPAVAGSATTSAPESPAKPGAGSGDGERLAADTIITGTRLDAAASLARQNGPASAAGPGPLAAPAATVPGATPGSMDNAAASQLPASAAAAWSAADDAPNREGQRARAAFDPTAAAVDRATLAEPSRVRQAADILRQWQVRSATAQAAADDSVALARQPSTSGAGATVATSAAAPSAGAFAPAEPGALSLASGDAAAQQLVQRMLEGQARNSNHLRFQLSPAELGQLEVNMRRQGDRLQITFTASHAGARELIEASLPNLRALLSDVGIQLTDADVRHEGSGRDASRGGYAGTGDGGAGTRQQDAEAGRGPAAGGSEPHDTGVQDIGGNRLPGAASGGIDAFA